LSVGAALVLLAALRVSLSNVAVPVVYDASGNPHTILVLRNVTFLALCGRKPVGAGVVLAAVFASPRLLGRRSAGPPV
jgi:hypothetical protein